MNYIDLGLSSGLLWSDTNEDGFYTFDEAVENFGDSMPTKEDFRELYAECEWEWDKERKGYTVTGKNGNSIFLPCCGYRGGASSVGAPVTYGSYWSSSARSADNAYSLYFGATGVSPAFNDYCRCGGSVRLVKREGITDKFPKIPLSAESPEEWLQQLDKRVAELSAKVDRIIGAARDEVAKRRDFYAEKAEAETESEIKKYYEGQVAAMEETLEKLRR